MHLEGPWLSTTGKKKGKQKFASADHARKARELDESWKALQKKWAIESDEKKRKRGLTATTYVAPKVESFRRTTPHIASLNSEHVCGVATMPAPKVYTGTMVKGIATMHKSNAVPVFSSEEAQDISKMRR
jgi:N-acetylglucosamine-6-phosphate deacetylase